LDPVGDGGLGNSSNIGGGGGSAGSGCDAHAQARGAAAGLIALLAVWRGARRVTLCLPGAGDEDDGYGAAAAAVLEAAESSVVVERLALRRYGQDCPRQGALLARELINKAGEMSPVDVVIGWEAAAAKQQVPTGGLDGATQQLMPALGSTAFALQLPFMHDVCGL
jgi:hypothetical protein